MRKEMDMAIIKETKNLYGLDGFEFKPVSEHEGGRNKVFVCSRDGEKKYVLRVSELDDRTFEDYLAETEFICFLKENGASVAGVIPSVNGVLVERIGDAYVCLFEYAKGMLMYDNGYRYREGAPLEEYFYNTGKTIGRIHKISKGYEPSHKRISYFDKYNTEYIDDLIPDTFGELKEAIAKRTEEFAGLPVNKDVFGMVHFDYCDGNYHVDMSTGEITVFDFDNCIYCWYMFDLAHTWTHGIGWCQFEPDPKKRLAFMEHFFDTVIEGYRSETDVSDDMPDKLQLFIDMTLIENIVDEFECAAHEGEEVDEEDIRQAAFCQINDISLLGIG